MTRNILLIPEETRIDVSVDTMYSGLGIVHTVDTTPSQMVN